MSDADFTLLYYALRGDAAGLGAALDHGANPNAEHRRLWSVEASVALELGNAENWCRLFGSLSEKIERSEFDQARTALLLATEFGHYDALVVLLDRGADPNFAGDEDVTPLWAAAHRGDLRCAEALLRAGAEPNRGDVDGRTPLFEATKAGSLALVTRLLAAGADPNAATWQGVTPLMAAVARGEVSLEHRGERRLRRPLLSKEREQNEEWERRQSTLFDVPESIDSLLDRQTPAGEYPEIVRRLLAAGARADAVRHEAGRADHPLYGMHAGETALHYAASSGCAESVGMLLAAGAGVDAGAGTGAGTPLRDAAIGGSVEVVGLLLDAGADVRVADENGWTALMASTWRDRPDVTTLLLRHGADARATRKEDGGTALHNAADAGHAVTAAVLLAYGAAVDARDSNGMTPLMVAARSGRAEVAATLLASGADINARDGRGRTALDWCRAESMTDKMLAKQPDLAAAALAELDASRRQDDLDAEQRAELARMMERQMASVLSRMRDRWQRASDRERQAREAVTELLRAAGAVEGG